MFIVTTLNAQNSFVCTNADQIPHVSSESDAEHEALFELLRVFEPGASSRIPPATEVLAHVRALIVELADLRLGMGVDSEAL